MLPLLVVLDLVGLIGGAWVLWKPRLHDPRPGEDVARLMAWTAVLALGAALTAIVVFGSWFAVLRLWCHVLFCVFAPLAMARGVWWCRHHHARIGAAMLVLGLAMEAVYVYARRVEPFALEVNRHVIETRRLAVPVRVVVLADLQADDIGSYEAEVFARIDSLKPDLLLLAGDYIQVFTDAQYAEQLARLRALFRDRKHEPALGTFAIMGDTDHDPQMFAGTPVVMLEGRPARIGKLQVLGLRYEDTFRALGPRHLQWIRDFSGLTIVLGHRPDFMADVVERGSDVAFVAVAGHTHGGQIVVPGFGPPLTLSSLPRRFASGVHRLGQAWLCASRGVGLERLHAPRIRLFCPPELVVLELR